MEKVRANDGAQGVVDTPASTSSQHGSGTTCTGVEPDVLGELLPGTGAAVELPKDHGAGARNLGVPNAADRVAQTEAAMLLEERIAFCGRGAVN